MQEVTAVIVTFNRSQKLRRVLDALSRQTLRPQTILVVDNASTDDTADVVENCAQALPGLRYLRLSENVGGAGGFHAGLTEAYRLGGEYYWISDDDAYPEENALANLVNAIEAFQRQTGRAPSFACSRVEWIDGSLCEMNTPQPVWDWPRFVSQTQSWALVGSCSFVSCLVPRWAVGKHGLPIKDYFIWFDDAEYTRRLSGSYPGIFVPESKVVHDTPENKGVNFRLVTSKNIWKFKYGARNEASYHRKKRGIVGYLGFFARVQREMRQGHVGRKLVLQIYGALLRGWFFSPKVDHVQNLKPENPIMKAVETVGTAAAKSSNGIS